MNHVTTRPAVLSDLPRLAEIYNHYILNTPITFNTQPFSLEGFAGWFEEHSDGKRHRLVIAVENGDDGRVIGYAGTSRFRPKEAYETTVETTIYCSPESTQRGVGTLLYRALFGRGHQSNCGGSYAAESGIGRVARTLRIPACRDVYGKWAQVREVLGCSLVRKTAKTLSAFSPRIFREIALPSIDAFAANRNTAGPAASVGLP